MSGAQLPVPTHNPPPKLARPGRKKKEKSAEVAAMEAKLPGTLPWAANSNARVKTLVATLSDHQNVVLLRGKVNKTDNTQGENLTAMYKRVTIQVWPEYADCVNILYTRVKTYVEGMIKKYNKLAKQLRVTGGGLNDPNASQDKNPEADKPNPVAETHDSEYQELEFYVPAEGPTENTPDRAKNLWESLTEQWEWFPDFHKMMAFRPNVTPIVLVTGVTPNGGPNAILIQPIDGETATEKSAPAQPPRQLDLQDVDTSTVPTVPAIFTQEGWDKFKKTLEDANPGSMINMPAAPPDAMSHTDATQAIHEYAQAAPTLASLLHQLPPPVTPKPSSHLPLVNQSLSSTSSASTAKNKASKDGTPSTKLKRGESRAPQDSNFKAGNGSKMRGQGGSSSFEAMLSGHLGKITQQNFLRESCQTDLKEKKLLCKDNALVITLKPKSPQYHN
ncbi:hypothetical protein DL96DRAFT_1771704 [Flagelloscypha sp. PMI_526]|nr:hypothetical protein DL96DRAFT_1771704 [Flagelloscypha sp. PMI_526]